MVASVMAQTYSGTPSKRPVSVTHTAAQTGQAPRLGQLPHLDGIRSFFVTSRICSLAAAKAVSWV